MLAQGVEHRGSGIELERMALPLTINRVDTREGTGTVCSLGLGFRHRKSANRQGGHGGQ